MTAPRLGPYWTSAGKRRTFGKLSTWAEDGLIFCEWQADSDAKQAGDAEVLEIRAAENWVKNLLSDLAIWDRAREGAPSAKERAYAIEYYHTLKGHLEVMSETIRDAKDQGDQNDPEIRRKKLTAFLRSRRDTTGNRGRETASVGQQVDALFYPTTTGKPLIFLPSKPIAVIPPELPPNFRG